MDEIEEKLRVVDRAEHLVSERHLLPFLEKAQQQSRWDESEQILFAILRHTTRLDRTYHARIRLLLSRGLAEQAMEEAALVFALYREQGRFLQALQVARAMRHIDPCSARPYNLELEYLLEIGCRQQAQLCQEELLRMLEQTQQQYESGPCKARFQILLRRPQRRELPRLPQSWTASPPIHLGEVSNLPALLEDEGEPGRLWWSQEGNSHD